MRTALALAALLLALPARAEVVDFRVVHKVLAGSRDRPSITLVANADADDVEVKLERDDGRKFHWRTGKLRAGATKQFMLEVPPGRERRFTGTLAVTAGGETRTAGFDFNAEIITPARIEIEKSRVSLAEHTLEVVSSRPTSRVEVTITSDEGETIGQTEVPFDAAPPGTPLKVTWEQGAGTVMRIAIRVFDPDEFYAGVELFPWRIDIPHEEVHFATNSARIETSEEPKLDRSLAHVVAAVEKYGRFAHVKLFVAGHTDTVGSADSNRALSLQRARAICEFFRRRGLRIPLFFEGFGEDSLKVATPDEADEVENRRAEYIVAIEPPPIDGGRSGSWKPLR